MTKSPRCPRHWARESLPLGHGAAWRSWRSAVARQRSHSKRASRTIPRFCLGVQENEKRKTYLIQPMNNGVNKDFSHEHMCFLRV